MTPGMIIPDLDDAVCDALAQALARGRFTVDGVAGLLGPLARAALDRGEPEPAARGDAGAPRRTAVAPRRGQARGGAARRLPRYLRIADLLDLLALAHGRDAGELAAAALPVVHDLVLHGMFEPGPVS